MTARLILASLLVAALSGCGGEEAPPPATTSAPLTTAGELSGWVAERPTRTPPLPRTQVVAATLRTESLDLDGDGTPDRERSFEDLQPLSGIQLPGRLR